MKNAAYDKSLIALLISPIVGILVMKGVIAPQYADELIKQTELWIGATIFLGGLLIGVIHHTAIQQQANVTLIPEEGEAEGFDEAEPTVEPVVPTP